MVTEDSHGDKFNFLGDVAALCFVVYIQEKLVFKDLLIKWNQDILDVFPCLFANSDIEGQNKANNCSY